MARSDKFVSSNKLIPAKGEGFLRIIHMSNAARSTNREDEDAGGVPRAMIHQQILDAAKANPRGSLEEIADEVSGASITLVERVLDQYGDPGSDQQETEPNPSTESTESRESTESTEPTEPPEAPGDAAEQAMTDTTSTPEAEEDRDGPHDATFRSNAPEEDTRTEAVDDHVASSDEATVDADDESPQTEHASECEQATPPGPDTAGDDEPDAAPSLESLTATQRETLEAIYEEPTATQAELGERFDVSRATICQRVNAIPGFDWKTRATFVEDLFDDDTDEESTESPMTNGHHSADLAAQVSTLTDHVELLEQQLQQQLDHHEKSQSASTQAMFDDPELAHKVVHACMQSDQITEEEELRILKAML